MIDELRRRMQMMGMNGDPFRVSTNRLPMELGSSNNALMGGMGQKFGGLLGLTDPVGFDPMMLNQSNMPTPTFATPNAPQYGTTDSALSGNPTESSASVKEGKTDWKGMADGLGSIADGLTGNIDDVKFKPAPQMQDDTAQRAAAASQLWQSVVNKRKPKGLI